MKDDCLEANAPSQIIKFLRLTYSNYDKMVRKQIRKNHNKLLKKLGGFFILIFKNDNQTDILPLVTCLFSLDTVLSAHHPHEAQFRNVGTVRLLLNLSLW